MTDANDAGYVERPLVKTKIIATLGPACEEVDKLRKLAVAGVDVFRLNFAHGAPDWMARIVGLIRDISEELDRPIAILGDLAGPKIRLGELPEDGINCGIGNRFEFVRDGHEDGATKLTTSYKGLIDDLRVDDRVLLADGTVVMRIVEKPAAGDRLVCEVEQPGLIRSRQGVNLPGAAIKLPALTDKDRTDLVWALEHKLDYVGLSFVASADDVRRLRLLIEAHGPEYPPQIISKIERMEAVAQLDHILDETDAVMVARGDLGVEVDMARVPVLQKRIIRLCNQHRIPVITATQMLDSMQSNELPTRAEASDVANAVLDGSDAVMLSGETAVGQYPVRAVAMMSRIVYEAERLVTKSKQLDSDSGERTRALVVTEAVTLGASTVAEHLEADLIVVATHSGRTAMAVSKQRSPVAILALTDNAHVARRMCLYWGVKPMHTDVVYKPPQELLAFAVAWGKRHKVIQSGSRLVLVGSSNWSDEGHDLMLVHAVE